MHLHALRRFLDELLPNQTVTDSAWNGLQVEGKESVSRIATAVSATEETIEAAIAAQADVLIVHHGLFWQKDSPLIEGSKRRKLAHLLRHELSLFAYHLPLDLHRDIGNNWKAAHDLGWQHLQPFGYYGGVPIGVRGEITPCSADVLCAQLEHYYAHSAVYAPGGPELIKHVALISGGAYRSLPDAARAGIDAFITGNFDEPAWYQAREEGIHFFALGHSATERVGPQALASYLEQHLSLSCHFLDIKNPF